MCATLLAFVCNLHSVRITRGFRIVGMTPPHYTPVEMNTFYMAPIVDEVSSTSHFEEVNAISMDIGSGHPVAIFEMVFYGTFLSGTGQPLPRGVVLRK